MIIAGTGHRPNKLGNDYSHEFADYGPINMWVYEKLEKYVMELNPTEIISGLALGLDQILATLALRVNIPLTAAIPFVGQESMWPRKSREYYYELLSKASRKVIVSEGGYANWKMQKRNEWMVDQLIPDYDNRLLGLWDGTDGGTANCVRYANKVLKKEQITISSFVISGRQDHS